MSIEIISQLKPKNDGKFALLDDQHLRGSYRVCQTLIERNAIPVDNLKYGMKVFVQENSNTYILESDLSTWTLITEPVQEYIHNQIIGSALWDITHPLNRFPAITVVDSGGNVIVGDVNYIDAGHITVSFTGSFSGKAYLN